METRPMTMTAAELASTLGTDDAPFLLDVRELEEAADWSIPGTLNIPLGELAERLGELPADRQIVTVCASGGRSAAAAQLLTNTGFSVADLQGGMAAWGRTYDAAELQLDGVRVVQIRRRGKGCLSYLVGAGDEAFAIDPSSEVDVYLDRAEANGWRITRVFETHLHADHLSGARELAARTSSTLHLNAADHFDFAFEPVLDGQRFALPGGAELIVAAVPGHTEGSTSYLLAGSVVFSGDTLFVDGVGRPDLAEQAARYARNLHRSLHDKLLALGDDVLVLPAHYSDQMAVAPKTVVGASIGRLRKILPPLSFDEADFVDWVTAQLSERPSNYHEILAVNRGEAPLDEAARQLEVGPNRCSA